jgi:hypothetical protein
MFTAIEAMFPNYTDSNLHGHPILMVYKIAQRCIQNSPNETIFPRQFPFELKVEF